MTADECLAAIGFQNPRDNAEHGGFSGSVGTYQPVYPAASCFERNVLHSARFTISFGYAVRRDGKYAAVHYLLRTIVPSTGIPVLRSCSLLSRLTFILYMKLTRSS